MENHPASGPLESADVRAARLQMIGSMIIFGTIGLFVRKIGYPSSLIAMCRGYIGFVFLASVLRLRGKQFDRAAIRNNLTGLLLSGACIGVNWILLFEAYRFTTIPVATLCYYMQPVIVTAASALLFREKLTGVRLLCVLTALAGMSFVSGVWSGVSQGSSHLTGILLGLGAACFYATVILINKKLGDIPPYDQTMIQLLAAAVTVTPYVLLTVRSSDIRPGLLPVTLLLFVGVFHTGFAYVLYFGPLRKVSAQTAAILSYIDPVVAILLSALLFHEPVGLHGWIGAGLILGSALFSELFGDHGLHQ